MPPHDVFLESLPILDVAVDTRRRRRTRDRAPSTAANRLHARARPSTPADANAPSRVTPRAHRAAVGLHSSDACARVMPARRGADGRSKPAASGDGGAKNDADGARAVDVAALKMIDDDGGATTSSRGADSSSATVVTAGGATTTTFGTAIPLATVAMLDAAQLATQQRKAEMSRKRKSTLPNGERKP